MKERTKEILMLIPILILGGIFLPLASFLQPLHNDDFLFTLGILGTCAIALPYAFYGIWYIHKLSINPTNGDEDNELQYNKSE